jgi:Rrf2 family protein
VHGIGRQTDYAARVILHLASLPEGGQVSIAEIAQRRLLPLPFLRRVVAKLVEAGLVTAVRGARGGISLARPASAISLLDVVRAMEGGVVLNRCVDQPAFCPLAEVCPVQRVWTRLTRELEASLEAVRFDKLADGLAPNGRSGRAASRGQDAIPAAAEDGQQGTDRRRGA